MSRALLEAPATIAGRYRIEALIGEGGMGSVYRARQLALDREVAVKVMHPEHAARPGARKRFEREARVASRIKHPNAVDVYDFGDDGGMLFLAMELLRGRPLRSIVDVDLPPVPLERALRICADIADVLQTAHAIGLVHRDIKPENVFLEHSADGTERTVVVDFGLAFMLGDPTDGRITREGVVTGTPDYVSPEQARGEQIGPSSDVYSLGCVLYEMLTSATPFSGDQASVLARHLFVDAPSLRREGVVFPSALEELVARMLKKKPNERPDALAVRDALVSLDGGRPERFGKGRVDAPLGRAARMISAPPSGTVEDLAPAEPSARTLVRLVGEAPAELELGLAATGLVLSGSGTAEAVLALGTSVEEAAQLVADGLPVLADAPADDHARLTELIRAGVQDVVVAPASPEATSRKLWGVIKKRRRRNEHPR